MNPDSRRSALVRGAPVVLTLVTALLTAGGCATNPATGRPQLALISESQEIAMGRESAEQVDATMGLYQDDALEVYVDRIGQRLAAASERPDLPWRFAVVDDDVVNAFALPGGYIYLTRGILAHFNSEAELAAVLGHEIGHVTGRHSVEQLSRQQLASLGLGIGGALYSPIRGMSGVLSQGLGVLFLKYGRDDEREADTLGVRYMVREGYDPNAAVAVFEMLGRKTEAAGGQQIPSWLSTHPAPADRRERLKAQIAENPARADRVAREAYLERIDGLVYGKDPRHGYFEGERFVHPELEFAFTLPGGWQRQNLSRAVVAQHPDGAAALELTLAATDGHAAAAEAFLSQPGISRGDARARRVSGLPATEALFAAQTERGSIGGLVTFIDFGGRTYRVLGMTAREQLNRFLPIFRDTAASFARITDRRLLDVEPARVELLRLDEARSITGLKARRASPLDAEELAILNGVDAGEVLPAGRLVKWVR